MKIFAIVLGLTVAFLTIGTFVRVAVNLLEIFNKRGLSKFKQYMTILIIAGLPGSVVVCMILISVFHVFNMDTVPVSQVIYPSILLALLIVSNFVISKILVQIPEAIDNEITESAKEEVEEENNPTESEAETCEEEKED